MMVLDDLKDQIPLREVSRISGISLSGYYYKPRNVNAGQDLCKIAGVKVIHPI